MKTIASCVEEIIATSPFLEDGLSRQIINFSAMAKDLNAPISRMLKRSVKDGAIMMALRRYQLPAHLNTMNHFKSIFKNLGDITVRSDLSDFTFKNSESLINSHAQILEEIKFNPQIFYAFTRGNLESNLIISSSCKAHVLDAFKTENQIGLQENLSAISIYLPRGNSKIAGLYYQIFKRLAWENITLYEVVSTTNEFTIVVEDHLVDTAFSVINRLKN